MTEQQITELEQRLTQKFEGRLNALENSNRVVSGNLKFLRDLVEECVHLTEQTSGIVVEHVTTLDNRMNSVGTIFTDKIKRQLKELDEATLMEAVITQVEVAETSSGVMDAGKPE